MKMLLTVKLEGWVDVSDELLPEIGNPAGPLRNLPFLLGLFDANAAHHTETSFTRITPPLHYFPRHGAEEPHGIMEVKFKVAPAKAPGGF